MFLLHYFSSLPNVVKSKAKQGPQHSTTPSADYPVQGASVIVRAVPGRHRLKARQRSQNHSAFRLFLFHESPFPPSLMRAWIIHADPHQPSRRPARTQRSAWCEGLFIARLMATGQPGCCQADRRGSYVAHEHTLLGEMYIRMKGQWFFIMNILVCFDKRTSSSFWKIPSTAFLLLQSPLLLLLYLFLLFVPHMDVSFSCFGQVLRFLQSSYALNAPCVSLKQETVLPSDWSERPSIRWGRGCSLPHSLPV